MAQQELKLLIDDAAFLLHMNDRFPEYCTVWNVKRHCNATYELHIVLQGRCELDVRAHTYVLNAGSAVLIPPGEYHRPYVLSGPFRRLSVPFSLSKAPLSVALRKASQNCTVFPASRQLLYLSEAVLAELSEKLPFYKDRLPALFTDLMVCMLRALNIGDCRTGGASIAPADGRTDLIDEYFENNFALSGTQQQLAAKLHLSRRQLSRVLLEHYGMNFRQKLLAARMDHAAWLLRTTDKSIGEICSIVGYNSETTFFKNFKSSYQSTPLQYRKRYKLMNP